MRSCGTQLSVSQERRFTDDLPSISISRLRAEGVITPETKTFLVKLGDVEAVAAVREPSLLQADHGGLGFTALGAKGVVVVPIRTGLGWRLGVNVNYLKFTHDIVAFVGTGAQSLEKKQHCRLAAIARR